jgi:cytochrome P450
LVWRPQRWITGSGAIESETLFKPLKGTYFPWSEGIRNCPGKKFAQVEFVAVLATLLTNHVAEPVAGDGEPLDTARARVLEVVKDSSVELLLQVRDPRSIPIRWRERTDTTKA